MSKMTIFFKYTNHFHFNSHYFVCSTVTNEQTDIQLLRERRQRCAGVDREAAGVLAVSDTTRPRHTTQHTYDMSCGVKTIIVI